jgi:hypothetical protein
MIVVVAVVAAVATLGVAAADRGFARSFDLATAATASEPEADSTYFVAERARSWSR